MTQRIVGNYEIIEKIGEGGMGDVLRGLDLMLEREVAIKVLHPSLARQPQVVERFRSEAVTLAKLNHPNIATLYSFFRHGDEFFMVMEFVHGRTLASLLAESRVMPCDLSVALLAAALDGLAHAHSMGIVHRDIKPSNIMRSDIGMVKIMDFGIARVLGTARMTRVGHLVGTIEYMSPEQVHGEEGDERSDLYAMGILLYEMVTGRVPFAGNSDFEIMKHQAEAAPPPPRTLDPSLPEGIEAVILRALEKDPRRRFQNADEMKLALLEAIPISASATFAGRISIPDLQTASQLKPTMVAPRPITPPKETKVATDYLRGANETGLKETRVAGDLAVPSVKGPVARAVPWLNRLNPLHLFSAAGLVVLVTLVWYWAAGPASPPQPAAGPTAAQPGPQPAGDSQSQGTKDPVKKQQGTSGTGSIDPERLPGVLPAPQGNRPPAVSTRKTPPAAAEAKQPQAGAQPAETTPLAPQEEKNKETSEPGKKAPDEKAIGPEQSKKPEPDPRNLLRRYLKKDKKKP